MSDRSKDRPQDRNQPLSSVPELCKKLKTQLDELALSLAGKSESPAEQEDLQVRKELFKALQEQLSELSS